MFKNARVHDKVWSYIDGWGEIIEVNISDFPIKVKFKNGSIESFMVNGAEYYNNLNPTLFWDEVKFEIPKPVNTDASKDCGYKEDVKFEYPIYKRSKLHNSIVKFTGLTEGVVVENIDIAFIGYVSNTWVKHTDEDIWEDISHKKIEPTYYKWERLHDSGKIIETTNFVTDTYAEKHSFKANGWRKIKSSKRTWEEDNNHS